MESDNAFGLFATVCLLSVVVLIVVLPWTRPKDLASYSKLYNWKSYHATGYKWFGCAKDEWYHTGFVATTQDGQTVHGVVCDGLLFKNATIRLKY